MLYGHQGRGLRKCLIWISDCFSRFRKIRRKFSKLIVSLISHKMENLSSALNSIPSCDAVSTTAHELLLLRPAKYFNCN